MYRNYFLFEKQVSNLRKQLQGARITSCFSYRKDELILECQNDVHYFLRMNIQTHLPYLVLDTAHNIRDPRIELFKNLLNDRIIDLKIIRYDKKVNIETGKYIVQCIFYGSNQNIILTGLDGKIESSFKKIKNTETRHLIDERLEQFSASQIQDIDKPVKDQSIADFIKQNIGGYNNLLIKELCFRSKCPSEKKLLDINKNEWAEIKENLSAVEMDIDSGPCYIYEHPARLPIFSLLPLTHLESLYVPEKYDVLNKAWRRFLYLHDQKHQVQQKIARCQSVIRNRIEYLNKTLKKISDFSDLEEKKKISETKGHLLQTFSNEIKRGDQQAVLKNIYSDQGEEMAIKLDPKLSVHENASRYFSKYKNIETRKTELVSKRDTYQDELKFWINIYEDSKKIDSLKKVLKLEELLTQKNARQKGSSINKSKVLDKSSFNRLLFDNKWEVLIGKNARNNDILTFKFAHKYDFWFHAQGVPGSHVIIHQADKNIDPPMTIIEKAASVAAYFSAAKTSATVPVNYTKVMYVRKPRKAEPGTVIISHSKTIFVEPKKYI